MDSTNSFTCSFVANLGTFRVPQDIQLSFRITKSDRPLQVVTDKVLCEDGRDAQTGMGELLVGGSIRCYHLPLPIPCIGGTSIVAMLVAVY